jgi:hypothetical protein
MDLLLAPFLAGVVLVEAGEIAVVALVQRQILVNGDAALAHFFEHECRAGALRALQRRGEGDVEGDAARFQFLSGGARLGNALLGEIDVAPAGEEVLQIPLALAVTDEHQQTFHCRILFFTIQALLRENFPAKRIARSAAAVDIRHFLALRVAASRPSIIATIAEITTTKPARSEIVRGATPVRRDIKGVPKK